MRRRRLGSLAAALAVALASAATAGAGWTAGASAGPQTVAAGSLAAPGGVSASISCVAHVTLSVDLSWSAAASATGYDVRRATVSGGPYTLVGSTATTAFSDATVAQQTTYYYVVVAKRASWTSASSAEVSATTPRSSNCK